MNDDINEHNSEMDELYQALIMEHSKRPRNFGYLQCGCHAKGKNPACGDEVQVHALVEGKHIADIKFTGSGCALCIASSSLMTQMLKGSDVALAHKTIDSFISFIKDEHLLDQAYEPLHVFAGIRNFPLRVKCVLLGWRAAQEALKNQPSCHEV